MLPSVSLKRACRVLRVVRKTHANGSTVSIISVRVAGLMRICSIQVLSVIKCNIVLINSLCCVQSLCAPLDVW